jgi:GNAT superfamily N-acetyltransferase
VGAEYFNHHKKIARNRWEWNEFTAAWWRIYGDDHRWVPPYFPDLRKVLRPGSNSYLQQFNALPWHHEALRRNSSTDYPALRTGEGHDVLLGAPMIEEPVAASIVLKDERRADGAAYLALLRSANHVESLERHLDDIVQELAEQGCRQIIGPTGLSPHLGSGILQDHWNDTPPLHTAYNPPYVPEILAGMMQIDHTSRLYWIDTDRGHPRITDTNIAYRRFDPADLSGDYLPMFRSAFYEPAGFIPPDQQEAAFLLREIDRWPMVAYLAERAGKPAGFVLLQPDLATVLQFGKGGRGLAGRLYILWASRKPAKRGRLVFGGVLPEWRRQGIGSLLFDCALTTAREMGWSELSIGPVPEGSQGENFLHDAGATPKQTYAIYRMAL